MNKFKNMMKDHKLMLDFINVLLGVIIVILIIGVFMYPQNRFIVKAAFLIGGLMNVVNGLKIRKDNTKQSMGMNLVMIGGIIIFIGAFLL
jgi:hypothetical protein